MPELFLDLSKHCIESELKRLHNRALADYFKTGADPAAHLEQIIDLTQEALSRLDFGYLRSHFPPLAGQSDAQVILVRKEDRLALTIDGGFIPLTEKNRK